MRRLFFYRKALGVWTLHRATPFRQCVSSTSNSTEFSSIDRNTNPNIVTPTEGGCKGSCSPSLEATQTSNASSPWALALRHLLCEDEHTRKTETTAEANDLEACVQLFRSCLRHGAPPHVCRAVYSTLRGHSPKRGEKTKTNPQSNEWEWHIAYARALHYPPHEPNNAIEALGVLLLDAAEDGVVLRPAGLLLSLTLLRQVAVAPTLTDPFAERLQGNTQATMRLATDVCRRILLEPSARMTHRQDAMGRLAAMGGIEPCRKGEISSNVQHVRPDQQNVCHAEMDTREMDLFLATLDALTAMLADKRLASEMARVLSLEWRSRSSQSSRRHLSVWLVEGIIQRMRVLHTKALSNTPELQKVWKCGTTSALYCLQRVMLHLPSSPTTARQRAFCLLLSAVRDGILYADENGDLMGVILQFYGEKDWRAPSNEIFVECLSEWRRYEVMRRLFTSLYRHDGHMWSRLLEQQEESDPIEKSKMTLDDQDDREETCSISVPMKWHSSLSLSGCYVVLQSACQADDPETGALVVRHMLRCLLAAKHSPHLHAKESNKEEAEEKKKEEEEEEEEEEGRASGVPKFLLGKRSLREWNELMCHVCIPMVDEAFRRTGRDIRQDWMKETHLPHFHTMKEEANTPFLQEGMNSFLEKKSHRE